MNKFEPVSGCGDMHHAEEAVCQLVIAGSDGTVDFEMAEHALDAVALPVKLPIMFDFTRRFDRPGMTASIFRCARLARMASAS